ncbi:MAG: FadR/GntR family transcriptional regulator [Paracoccaceae bacterium]|nr:FadR/GntR family transcriptional regulator [Paracoccaceae bacterium]
MTGNEERRRDLIDRVRPIGGADRLSDRVVALLRGWIDSGALRPGDRLPTEHELTGATGVSRAVVREAVARLKTDGLVTSRQGVGAFVAVNSLRRPFRIDPDQIKESADVVRVMELRLGVEVESAALAAVTATGADQVKLRAAHEAFAAVCAAGEPALEQDFAFHRAIAAASGNPLIDDFLGFLGPFIIPRPQVRLARDNAVAQGAYLMQLAQEHRAILEAILARDEDAARATMRAHLTRGIALNRGAEGTPDHFAVPRSVAITSRKA